jgi:hypothetical protein
MAYVSYDQAPSAGTIPRIKRRASPGAVWR